MKLKIKVEKLQFGTYMASVDWSVGDAGKVGTPGDIVYADSAGEAYENYKKRLEGKGHTVIEGRIT